MGHEQNLSNLIDRHISGWRTDAYKFKLNMIWDIPPIEFNLYEFEPKTNEILYQMQYVLDESIGKRMWIKKRSPPLGMVVINKEDVNRCEQYLDQVVDKHLGNFTHRCYRHEKDDFQGRLFKLITQLKPETKEQVCFKVIISNRY
jgi:hypothetical protein